MVALESWWSLRAPDVLWWFLLHRDFDPPKRCDTRVSELLLLLTFFSYGIGIHAGRTARDTTYVDCDGPSLEQTRARLAVRSQLVHAYA